MDVVQHHEEAAERLLAQLADGTEKHGPYAPSAATKAQAATAHALLAQHYAQKARPS